MVAGSRILEIDPVRPLTPDAGSRPFDRRVGAWAVTACRRVGDGDGVAVEGEGPAGLVHDVMVVVAERDDVDQDRVTAVLPVDDVMRLGPTVGSGASGVATAAVADLPRRSSCGGMVRRDRPTSRGRHVGAGDDPADRTVAEHAFDVGPPAGCGAGVALGRRVGERRIVATVSNAWRTGRPGSDPGRRSRWRCSGRHGHAVRCPRRWRSCESGCTPAAAREWSAACGGTGTFPRGRGAPGRDLPHALATIVFAAPPVISPLRHATPIFVRSSGNASGFDTWPGHSPSPHPRAVAQPRPGSYGEPSTVPIPSRCPAHARREASSRSDLRPTTEQLVRDLGRTGAGIDRVADRALPCCHHAGDLPAPSTIGNGWCGSGERSTRGVRPGYRLRVVGSQAEYAGFPGRVPSGERRPDPRNIDDPIYSGECTERRS